TGYPSMLATNPASGRNRQRRVGEGHLGPTQDSVNGFFAGIFQKLEISRNSAIPDQPLDALTREPVRAPFVKSLL
ncbi:hypothetical protein, partial [Qipengyuania sp. NPDC077563]|uniref:hypothetical protein n=1 Tax=Qipengyuania sp. NPDC077563 TaxID=3364497 RepID=UPI00384FE626